MFVIMGTHYALILGRTVEDKVSDYSKMYDKLFNAITDAIEIMQKAQQETEEMFISAKEPEISFIYAEDSTGEDGDK